MRRRGNLECVSSNTRSPLGEGASLCAFFGKVGECVFGATGGDLRALALTNRASMPGRGSCGDPGAGALSRLLGPGGALSPAVPPLPRRPSRSGRLVRSIARTGSEGCVGPISVRCSGLLPGLYGAGSWRLSGRGMTMPASMALGTFGVADIGATPVSARAPSTRRSLIVGSVGGGERSRLSTCGDGGWDPEHGSTGP